MAERDRMTIEQVVRKVMAEEHADVLRESLGLLARELMESEVTDLIGACHGERNPDQRMTQRNGYRRREWDTRAGVIELEIPKLRQGSYFPHALIEPRRRGEQALLSVVQQAYVCGVSTRRVDQLVESLGLRVSRSEVSRICALLDEQVEAFCSRPLEGEYPYLWVDAKVEKVREGGRVVNKAVVVAHGVHETGRREILGIDVGAAETEAFWTEFLRGLVARGLGGVALVISDAHEGLKAAIRRTLSCAWQRCTVHFLRDCLGHARKDQHGLLGALIRPIFGAADGREARARLTEAIAALEERLPKVARILAQAEEDILAFYCFPPAHWPKLRSTNPLERFNREIGRRTDVVGIFPDDRSLIRLVGMLCLEQNDEWLVGRRYLSAAAMEPLLEKRLHRDPTPDDEEVRELTTA
ncbi:MAG: IS256 family transposase [Actinobacteria bacterium]|nr:IS256 family transposase [Actinomycetota bacterium]